MSAAPIFVSIVEVLYAQCWHAVFAHARFLLQLCKPFLSREFSFVSGVRRTYHYPVLRSEIFRNSALESETRQLQCPIRNWPRNVLDHGLSGGRRALISSLERPVGLVSRLRNRIRFLKPNSANSIFFCGKGRHL